MGCREGSSPFGKLVAPLSGQLRLVGQLEPVAEVLGKLGSRVGQLGHQLGPFGGGLGLGPEGSGGPAVSLATPDGGQLGSALGLVAVPSEGPGLVG